MRNSANTDGGVMISPETQARIHELACNIQRNVREHKATIVPAKPKPILPDNPTEAMAFLAQKISESIDEAKNLGVSPEKLAPLFNSLKGALEVTAELKGNLDRSNKTLILNKIDLNKEIEEYMPAIMLSRNINDTNTN
jgi:hypothetical protein